MDGKTHPSLGFGRSVSLSDDSSVEMISLDFGTECSGLPLFFATLFLPRLRGFSPEPGKIIFRKNQNQRIIQFSQHCSFLSQVVEQFFRRAINMFHTSSIYSFSVEEITNNITESATTTIKIAVTLRNIRL